MAAASAAAAPAGPLDEGAGAAPARFRGSKDAPAVPGLAASCWGQDQRRQRFPALSEDAEADVAVVGGGVVGLTTAYLLARAGKRVVLLESRVIGGGQTGRCLGDMAAWHTGLLSSLERWTSLEQRRQVVLSNAEAIDFVEAVVRDEGIPCGFERRDALVLPDAAGGEGAERALLQELEACRAAGLEAEMVESAGDAGGGRVVRLPGAAASLHPLQYLDGLADAITGKYGGCIYEATRLRRADQLARTLTTLGGFTVKVRSGYVLATAAPVTSSLVDSALHVLSLHAKQHVRRRYCLAFKVPKFTPGVPQHAVVYDAADPQHSALLVPAGRQSSSGGVHDLLLVSGEAHDQGQPPAQYGPRLEALEAWARQRWPMAGERLLSWSFQYFQAAEDLGLYGSDPTVGVSGSVYVATGDCGRVMAGGTVGANVVASTILGWLPERLYRELYSPLRKLRGGVPGLPAYSARYFKTTVQSALDMLLPLPRFLSGAADVGSLAAGEGRVVNSGLRKVALYRDQQGELHRFSGMCPHLGCLLQWNPEAKEWNCPCHGSCFSADGTNTGGPATIDMKRLS